MTNPNPGTPLASNLFGPSRLTRPLTGYEPKPASEEEEARLVPFAQPSPQQPEPLGGVRPFNPEYLRSLLRQGPGGPMAPGGPSSSNMQIVPALPVGAPQVLNPRDGPEPEDRGFQDAHEDVQEEGLVLMGRPAPSTPRNFPQPGSFIESSQAVIARWITRTTRQQQQQTTAQQNEMATGVATPPRERGATSAGLPKTSGNLSSQNARGIPLLLREQVGVGPATGQGGVLPSGRRIRATTGPHAARVEPTTHDCRVPAGKASD